MNERGVCMDCEVHGRRRVWATLSEGLWDKWLRFHDARLESRFRDEWREFLADIDLVVMLSGLVRLGGTYFLLASRRARLGIATHLELLALMATLTWILIHNYGTTRCRQRDNLSCRSIWIGFHRVMIAAGTSKVQKLLDCPIQTVASVSRRLVWESTVTRMAVLTFALPLQFKEHVIAHSICLLICVGWTSPICCRIWCKTGIMGAVFDRLLSNIDATFVQMALMGMGSWNASSPRTTRVESGTCWLVLGFVHTTGGFVIPTAVLYCGELYFRMKFLVDKGFDMPRVKRTQLICRSMVMVCWVSTVLLMCVWALLRSLQR